VLKEVNKLDTTEDLLEPVGVQKRQVRPKRHNRVLSQPSSKRNSV
jgi:hypothetical protein